MVGFTKSVVILLGVISSVQLASSTDSITITGCCAHLTDALCPVLVNNSLHNYPTYRDKKSADLIKMNGYPVEEYRVITEDGYILTIQRIPYSPKENNRGTKASKIPILVQHGLLASSASWFWQPTERSLVFMLADAGYDVYIGNARGTLYSREHVKLDPKKLPFWDFSGFEMSRYDIPAVIDKILSTSGHSQLNIIGHSLGGMQSTLALLLQPEYNAKVKKLFLMSPAIYTGNTTNSFLQALRPIYAPYQSYKVVNVLGKGQFLPSVVQKIVHSYVPYCGNTLLECTLCDNIYFLQFGFDPCQCYWPLFAGFVNHVPDATSAKTMSHGMQAVTSGEFQTYDYSCSRFDTDCKPPEKYNWANLDTPVIMFWGDNDNLVVPKDIAKTAQALGSNLKENIKVPCPGFNHLDFIAAKDADIYVYNTILKKLADDSWI